MEYSLWCNDDDYKLYLKEQLLKNRRRMSMEKFDEVLEQLGVVSQTVKETNATLKDLVDYMVTPEVLESFRAYVANEVTKFFARRREIRMDQLKELHELLSSFQE